MRDRYEALTPDCPSALAFEREVAEQCGVLPEGHPWLKPLRRHPPDHAASVAEPTGYDREAYEFERVAAGLRGEAAHPREDAAGGLAPGGVGHRMRRLDDLDALAGHGVAVAGDDEAFERARPVALERLRHRRRGLAGADHDRAALRRLGQEARDAVLGLGGVDRRGEHLREQFARSGVHAVGPSSFSVGRDR